MKRPRRKDNRQSTNIAITVVYRGMSLHSILGSCLTRSSYGIFTVQAMATGFKEGHWKILYVLLSILYIYIIKFLLLTA